MADLSVPWDGDISLDETGDFLTVGGSDELTQRVIRRALTNAYVAPGTAENPTPPDYIFDSSYGGNVRTYVDSLDNSEVVEAIKTRLLDQIGHEAQPSTVTPPNVDVQLSGNTIYINASIALSNGDVVLIPQLEVNN
jgi:hypothetical protein